MEPIIGEKYGRLTITGIVGIIDHFLWITAICECGTERKYRMTRIRRGRVKSCGCIKSEKKHDLCNHKLHGVWVMMRQRCNNPENARYEWYGARGIKVCEEWNNSFLAFYDWALKNGWKEGLQIDRIDNSGNYEPSNCRWATREANMNNTRQNHYITYNNRTMTVTEWSKELGIKRGTLQQRIKEYGWPIEKAFTEPIAAK